ncbi:MAG: hypothetical protein JF888_02880 [Candidatus Dormibacteraeota bacterium]|uniref:DUF4126 domain-containing protein n=1 Tax=Candidatus Dormiibacter inghamiae TaxID=3127013 RepID=A0A934KB28_9BACT|nr:hypothetical protein [Candidatus Dormibacteraeota bacterium]MBJ7605522.1 hypothetical protein [Candidatus Dormibacteraeota bacterium]
MPIGQLGRAAALGAAGGLRTFLPLAALGARGAPRRPWLARGLGVLAGGELIGDKLPATPSRLAGPALAGRAVSAGLAGARLAGPTGAAVAVLASAVTAYGGYHARRRLTEITPLPDWAVALAEDSLALALAGVGSRAKAETAAAGVSGSLVTRR